MATVVITGGTGLVGSALTPMLLAEGYDVIILSRHPKKSNHAKLKYAVWNAEAQTVDAEAISKADYIIHLAGAGVADKRWTAERKKEIIESRTKSSALLFKALKEPPNKVKAVISASAIGWYGSDKRHTSTKKPFMEDIPADTEFLGETCRLWEESITPVEQLGKRLVKLRIGIVLSNDGGALAEFKKPVKFGIAAVLGGGKQVISWVHIEDVCRLFLFALKTENLKGSYNAVAPAPVTNKELTLKLAEKIRGSFFLPVHVPGFILRLMLGTMSVEILKSATVSADKILSAGFRFLYPSIDVALKQLTERK